MKSAIVGTDLAALAAFGACVVLPAFGAALAVVVVFRVAAFFLGIVLSRSLGVCAVEHPIDLRFMGAKMWPEAFAD
jgi:hypothetical protein